MALDAIVQRVTELAQNKGLLTGVGVAGTISTAVLTGRASFKAAHHLAEQPPAYTKRGMIEEIWQFYIPPVGVGIVTVSAIILANRVAGKEAAALAAAYAVSEKALTEYREAVIKKLGTEDDIRDLVAQENVNRIPVGSREIIIAGTGDVLCFDILSGRYFQSSREEILKAENKINGEIINSMTASLSEFYDAIGLPATGFSDTMGFNANRMCQVRFSTQMSSDDRPCLAIDFVYDPILGYAKLWD